MKTTGWGKSLPEELEMEFFDGFPSELLWIGTVALASLQISSPQKLSFSAAQLLFPNQLSKKSKGKEIGVWKHDCLLLL